jgi:glucan biosynthesis protein C
MGRKAAAASMNEGLTGTGETATGASSRRYDLDWLRVSAFAGVFFYHCARFFNSSGWHIKNAKTSPVVDILIGLFEPWGMPLLFAVSGASIFFALRPGRAGRFLIARGLRLLVPLALGILVLAPPQIYLERLTHGEYRGGFFQYLPRYFTRDLAWTGVHLWYLEYLFLFTLVLTPLFLWLKRSSGRRALDALRRFSVRTGAIFLWAVPFALLAVLVDPFGLLSPAPPEAVLRLVMFPLFVVYGFLVFADDGIQRAIVRQRWAALALALALSAVPPLVSQGIREWGWKLGVPNYALVMTAGALLIWSCLLVFFGFAMRHWNVNRPLLAYANEAVLPFYILHHPVVLLIGFFVVRMELPIAVKYLIITAPAFIITLGLYEYGVRRFNPVRLLFGLKTRKFNNQI